MTEPQVWVLIGVFAAALFATIGIVTSSLTRTMKAGFAAVDAKFEAVDAKFEKVYVMLAHLDRDVQALMRREFGVPGD